MQHVKGIEFEVSGCVKRCFVMYRLGAQIRDVFAAIRLDPFMAAYEGERGRGRSNWRPASCVHGCHGDCCTVLAML